MALLKIGAQPDEVYWRRQNRAQCEIKGEKGSQ